MVKSLAEQGRIVELGFCDGAFLVEPSAIAAFDHGGGFGDKVQEGDGAEPESAGDADDGCDGCEAVVDASVDWHSIGSVISACQNGEKVCGEHS